MKSKRPSHREITGKLVEAKTRATAKTMAFVNAKATREDLLDLDILMEDMPELLPRILEELEPRFYQGSRPPQKSYENLIRGCELYAFSWESRTFGCAMYFKFALKGDVLWIVSLHRDKKPERTKGDELPQ